MGKRWYSRSQDLTYTNGNREKEYHLAFETTDAGLAGQIEKFFKDIMDGKPLPPVKAGDRYGKHTEQRKPLMFSDRNALAKKYEAWAKENGVKDCALSVISYLCSEGYIGQPAEQRTGRWVISSDGYYPYCSECGARPKSGDMTPYCPNCGAKMEGDNG